MRSMSSITVASLASMAAEPAAEPVGSAWVAV